MISIIHPSRQRPEKSFQTIQSWKQQAGKVDLEIIVSIDADDPCYNDYYELYRNKTRERLIAHRNRSAVDAINNGAKIAGGDILIVVSDDTECFQGWGEAIERKMWGRCDWIIKAQDGIQPWIITMPIMDIIYYRRFGYIYHPDYLHAFCDTEMTCVAELTGCKIVVDWLFPHRHYSEGFCEKDETYTRSDVHFHAGLKIFNDRIARKFDLKETPGILTTNYYTANYPWNK